MSFHEFTDETLGVSTQEKQKINIINVHCNNTQDVSQLWISHHCEATTDFSRKEKLQPTKQKQEETQEENKYQQKLNQKSDTWNYWVLGILYFYQGLMIGFTESTIPTILIQNKARFTSIGLMSFTNWPWNFQLINAPILDTYYSSKFGKRKTYIVPLQLCACIILLVFSFKINEYMEAPNIFMLVFIGIIIQYLFSVQDIAVSGWALTLLSPQNVSVASSCKNIGQTTGYIISSTVYIWLNSPMFLNMVLNTCFEKPILNPQSFFIVSALSILAGTIYISFFKKETAKYQGKQALDEQIEQQKMQQQPSQNQEQKPSLLNTLKILSGFTKNYNLKILSIFLLFQYLTTAPVDNISNLIILQKGLSREIVSSLAVLLIPVQFIAQILAFFLSKKQKEFTCLLSAVSLRFLNNIFKYYITTNFQHGQNDQSTIYMLYIWNAFDVIGGTVQSVSIASFSYRMCDHSVGGSFLTILNSINNFGFTWAGSFVLFIVDYFSFNKQFYISNIFFVLFFGFYASTLINFEKSDPSQWKLQKQTVKENISEIQIEN